jgi:hypothetical protein
MRQAPKRRIADFCENRSSCPQVPKRLQIFVVLVAWFMATGAQWDLVQTFGWGRMIVNYSRSMQLSAAVKKTFGGEMCGICRAVNQAKQQEEKSNVPALTVKAKLVMICSPAPQFVLSAPDRAAWSPSDREPLSAGRPVPPTPPPRVA